MFDLISDAHHRKWIDASTADSGATEADDSIPRFSERKAFDNEPDRRLAKWANIHDQISSTAVAWQRLSSVIFRSPPQNSFDRLTTGHLRIHVHGNSVIRLAGKDKELQL